MYWVSTGQQWNVLSQALPESPKPPPLTPIRATWSYFSEVKIQDLKVTCGEGREIYQQPRKRLKVQYIGIFEIEIDSFY